MKGLTVILLALALSATGASAQQQIRAGGPLNPAFGTDPIIRVTVSFRAAIEGADARAVPDPKAQDAARRALYDMAATECSTLSETFKAECRLGSLQIFPQMATPAQPPNGPPTIASLNATAIYELKPNSSVPAR
jgi:hypothetical protein